MASGPPSHDPTLSSASAPVSAPMNLSGIDVAQLQANGLQAVDQTQLMNILKFLPGVFTKVRRRFSFLFIFFAVAHSPSLGLSLVFRICITKSP
jgi:hypothetical protein